jgi:hypothetical protein
MDTGASVLNFPNTECWQDSQIGICHAILMYKVFQNSVPPYLQLQLVSVEECGFLQSEEHKK